MKYMVIILLILMLVSCEEGKLTPDPLIVNDIPFTQIFPSYETRTDYYGVYEEVDYNSWIFKSHLIDSSCERKQKPSICRKIGSLFKYDPSHVSGLETKYTFDLNIIKYNMIDPPYFDIMFQDWFDHDPDDDGGNHPFSTLKLKVVDDQLYLGAYNNKWQWDYSFNNPYDPDDPQDTQHLHPENELTGKLTIELNRDYHVELIIKDGMTIEEGETIIKIDGDLLSHEYYQTKPLFSIREGAVQWGQYWDKDYNTNVNYCVVVTGLDEKICKSNQVKFTNFNIYQRINGG